jgi:UDP-N-acetylglucosamine 2-epimerase (non-hydrolysing)/UDP-GlcNAc3NAcA epimerase
LTCHREENTNDDKDLLEILKAMEQLDAPTVYPVHPRNKSRATRLCSDYGLKKIILAEPVGYLESVCLVNHAKKIVTDSGGLQREAFFAKKKCVTILDFICWPETMVDGRNELSAPIAEEILEKISHEQSVNPNYQPFGDGHAAEKIVGKIEGLI